MRHARVVFVVVDVCLMAYWAATAMHLIPLDKAFKDYEDATIQAWNWSFLPLDSLAATLGFWGTHLVGRGRPFGREILIIGLTLTFCAGLMAVSFWALYGDINLGWWAPNIMLMIVPCVVCGTLLREDPHR